MKNQGFSQRGTSLALRVHDLDQNTISPWGGGVHTVQGDVDPGGRHLRPQCVGVVYLVCIRSVTRRVPVLNGYPPALAKRYPVFREYLRQFWAGTRAPVYRRLPV